MTNIKGSEARILGLGNWTKRRDIVMDLLVAYCDSIAEMWSLTSDKPRILLTFYVRRVQFFRTHSCFPCADDSRFCLFWQLFIRGTELQKIVVGPIVKAEMSMIFFGFFFRAVCVSAGKRVPCSPLATRRMQRQIFLDACYHGHKERVVPVWYSKIYWVYGSWANSGILPQLVFARSIAMPLIHTFCSAEVKDHWNALWSWLICADSLQMGW